MRKIDYDRVLLEKFGDPIGSYAGEPLMGVRDERNEGVCPDCGMMPVGGSCGCGSEEKCSCGKPVSMCDCEGHTHGMSEGTEPCSECGMYEVEGTCGCTHMGEGDLEEVTPPGHEKMVRGLKKNPDIDNPWAVAWAHQKKYGRPKSR